MTTTPSGQPITHCDTCGRTHPEGRAHCRECGRPSAFIDRESGWCLACLNGPLP